MSSPIVGEDFRFKPKNGGGGVSRPPVGSRQFAILRVSKISGKGKMAAAAKHNLRERETFNARKADVGRNIHLAGARTSDELAKLWEERAPEKVRKNAVHALEYVITASPEKMEEMGQTNSENYLRDALTWLQEKHGAENILSAVIHNDETTPHLQVMVIPLDERGKLNARALVGGKVQLSAMQTDFAERVGAKYELDRGIKNSKALHYDIKSYYARVNSNEMASVALPERATGGFLGRGGETDDEWHSRASEAASEAVRDVSARLSGERDAVTTKLNETKLKMADLEASNDRTSKSLQFLADAHNVYEGVVFDREGAKAAVRDFHKAYISTAPDIPESIREIIDDKLSSMGKQGFEEMELERVTFEKEASERAMEERQRISEEHVRQQAERFRERDQSNDHER